MRECACGEPIHANSSYCRYCRAHRAREAYKADTLTRKKQNARAIAYYRLEIGIIVKEPCRLCGEKEVEMHHPDYNKPKDIVWLCIPCHNEMHFLERKIIAKQTQLSF